MNPRDKEIFRAVCAEIKKQGLEDTLDNRLRVLDRMHEELAAKSKAALAAYEAAAHADMSVLLFKMALPYVPWRKAA